METDPGEKIDRSADHPDIVKRLEVLAGASPVLELGDNSDEAQRQAPFGNRALIWLGERAVDVDLHLRIDAGSVTIEISNVLSICFSHQPGPGWDHAL